LKIDPTTYSFGSVKENVTPLPVQQFTVSNTGDGATPLLQASSKLPAEFVVVNDQCSTKKLDPAATCTFGVQLKPGISGQLRSTTVGVEATGIGAVWADVSADVKAVSAKLTVDPTAFEFPVLPSDGSRAAKQRFTI